jgi:hypothetical protein
MILWEMPVQHKLHVHKEQKINKNCHGCLFQIEVKRHMSESMRMCTVRKNISSIVDFLCLQVEPCEKGAVERKQMEYICLLRSSAEFSSKQFKNHQ